MYNLLKIEFMKIKKSREFYFIFLAVCLISFGIMCNDIYCMELFIKRMTPEFSVTGIECYREMIKGKMYMDVLQNILIIIYICNDFEKRIVQSEDLAGYSRFEILASKAILCFMLKGVLTFGFLFIRTVGISIIYGLGQELTWSLMLKMLRMYLLLVLISFAISTVAIMISYIFKTIAVSVAVWVSLYFGYLMIGTALCDMFKSSQAVQYYFDNSIFEFYKKITLDMGSGDIKYIISMSLLRIVLVLFMTYIIFRKTELK